MSENSFLEDFSSLFDLGTVLEHNPCVNDQSTSLFSSSLPFSASKYNLSSPSKSSTWRAPHTSPSFSSLPSSLEDSYNPPNTSSKTHRTRIKSEIVKVPRLIITPDDTVEVIDDEFISYYEELIPVSTPQPITNSTSKLRLNLSRGCGRDSRDTDHFVVPSLRLNYIDNNEYIEPVRDRDKCWVLDSQRPILNGDQEKQEKAKLVGGTLIHSLIPS